MMGSLSLKGKLVRVPLMIVLLPFILLAFAADYYVKGWTWLDGFLVKHLPR